MTDKQREEMKETVKILLNIQDKLQDAVLDILIKNTEAHLKSLLRKINPDLKEVPEEIFYILVEVTIRRFNRLGSEGMQSESVEGHSMTFNDSDFNSYLEIIEDYAGIDDREDGPGKALFI